MSYYTEKNGLAQFWNRDMTRLEWAKWVYHHPEQTEKLIEILLQAQQGSSDLAELRERLERNDAVDMRQAAEILDLQMSEGAGAISIEALQALLENL